MRGKKGFTLIELIITIFLVIILASIVFLSYKPIKFTNEYNAVDKEAKVIVLQLQRYYDISGSFPADFKAFLKNENIFGRVPPNPFWYGEPEDGWKFAGNTLTAIDSQSKVIISQTVSIPEGASLKNLYNKGTRSLGVEP